MAVTGRTTHSCWDWNATPSHSLGTWRQHRLLVCSTFGAIRLHLKCECLSVLGVSAIRGCEYVENFSDVIPGNFVVKLNVLGYCGLKGKACLWNCKSPSSSYVSPRRGSLSWCYAYAASVSLQVSFFSVCISSWDLICSMGRYTTATAEGPKFGVHSVNRLQAKQTKGDPHICRPSVSFYGCFVFSPQLFIIVNNLPFLTFCCK